MARQSTFSARLLPDEFVFIESTPESWLKVLEVSLGMPVVGETEERPAAAATATAASDDEAKGDGIAADVAGSAAEQSGKIVVRLFIQHYVKKHLKNPHQRVHRSLRRRSSFPPLRSWAAEAPASVSVLSASASADPAPAPRRR